MDVEVNEPSMEQIMDAISRMDGHVCSYVMLFPGEPGEIFFMVGGGKDGKFIVKHWDGEAGVEHTIIDPAASPDEMVEFPLVHVSLRNVNEIFDLATAQRAAASYATTGKLAQEFHWEKA